MRNTFSKLAGIFVVAAGLSSGAAMAVPVACSTVNTIGEFVDAIDGCTQGDKLFILNSTDLDASVSVFFATTGGSGALMSIAGFDLTDAAGAWAINYSISVTDPLNFITSMSAGADVSGGETSLLTKDVTGDETFTLTVVNGAEGPGSVQTGLNAVNLTIDETFSAAANTELNSVSNTFLQDTRTVPEPGTLVLLGLGLLAAGVARRTRS